MLTSCDYGRKVELDSFTDFEESLNESYSDFILLKIRAFKPDTLRITVRVRGDKEWSELKNIFENYFVEYLNSDDFKCEIANWKDSDQSETSLNISVQIVEYYDNDVQEGALFTSTYTFNKDSENEAYAKNVWQNTENNYIYEFIKE